MEISILPLAIQYAEARPGFHHSEARACTIPDHDRNPRPVWIVFGQIDEGQIDIMAPRQERYLVIGLDGAGRFDTLYSLPPNQFKHLSECKAAWDAAINSARDSRD